jgi:hypothetical protein
MVAEPSRGGVTSEHLFGIRIQSAETGVFKRLDSSSASRAAAVTNNRIS